MRYITGKVISKKLIAHYLGISENDIEHTTDTYGKPQVKVDSNKEDMQFNISHSGEIDVSIKIGQLKLRFH